MVGGGTRFCKLPYANYNQKKNKIKKVTSPLAIDSPNEQKKKKKKNRKKEKNKQKINDDPSHVARGCVPGAQLSSGETHPPTSRTGRRKIKIQIYKKKCFSLNGLKSLPIDDCQSGMTSEVEGAAEAVADIPEEAALRNNAAVSRDQTAASPWKLTGKRATFKIKSKRNFKNS